MITLTEFPDFPEVEAGHDVSEIIISRIEHHKIPLDRIDILCVASKIISTAEKRIESLHNVTPSNLTNKIHSKIPRKDPRLIQKIIEETGRLDDSRLIINDNYIGAWLPNGLMLTSGGIDKVDSNHVILLPQDADESAKRISRALLRRFGKNIGVVITDSDGRIDKRGSTQVAIGVYGLPPLRKQKTEGKMVEETVCDMVAAASGLIMGQRGTGKPVVCISGLDYLFNDETSIKDALVNPL